MDGCLIRLAVCNNCDVDNPLTATRLRAANLTETGPLAQ